MADMKKKRKKFWEYIERFDVIGLCETWIEEKEWERIRSKLSNNFTWNVNMRKGREREEERHEEL